MELESVANLEEVLTEYCYDFAHFDAADWRTEGKKDESVVDLEPKQSTLCGKIPLTRG